MSIAWPVPTATTFTAMPVALANSGSRWPNRPDCSVDVVDAITMDCAHRAAPKANVAAQGGAVVAELIPVPL